MDDVLVEIPSARLARHLLDVNHELFLAICCEYSEVDIEKIVRACKTDDALGAALMDRWRSTPYANSESRVAGWSP